MTMTEEVPVRAVLNLEAIYGQETLDEVAAVTALGEGMKGDLLALIARATEAVAACYAAETRLAMPHRMIDHPFQLLHALSGLAALEALLDEVGLRAAVFDVVDNTAPPVEPGR